MGVIAEFCVAEIAAVVVVTFRACAATPRMNVAAEWTPAASVAVTV